MCVVSMVGDFYGDKWDKFRPFIPPQQPYVPPINVEDIFPKPKATKEELDALRKEVEDLKELLKRAKLYDEKNNEPNCEIDEKMDFLRKVAALVGIDLDDVLKKSKT